MQKTTLILCLLASMNFSARFGFADNIIDFEELTPTNDTFGGQFYNGNQGIGNNSDGWSSGGVFFNNTYTDFGDFDAWEGWSYSNVVNTERGGFENQYAARPGGGANGLGGVNAGENYAVAFGSGAYFNLPKNMLLSTVELTNTTYAAISMRDGDAFAKQFGGETGLDPDFFRVTLTGFDDLGGAGGDGDAIGSITVDLADYTFEDSADDYILEDWLNVDLSSIADARSVALEFASSDVGMFGINTPTYVALDNLTLTAVPEPSSMTLLFGISIMGLLYNFRKYSSRLVSA